MALPCYPAGTRNKSWREEIMLRLEPGVLLKLHAAWTRADFGHLPIPDADDKLRKPESRLSQESERIPT